MTIAADQLPSGTLCLSFDDGPGRTEAADGPGPRSDELGTLLRSRGVRATFFVVGRFAETHGDVVTAPRASTAFDFAPGETAGPEAFLCVVECGPGR